MKRSHKKMVLRSVLAVLVISLALALFLFWPVIRSASSVKRLEDGLYSMNYSGDYGLEDFIAQGGGSSDMAVADFLIDRLFHGVVNLDLQGNSFGCSTLSIPGPDGTQLFGRNFDWGACATLIVQTRPRNGYASISTVNMDFLNLGLDLSEETSVRLMSAAAPYAPMDGINEKGLCAAVLMIEDRPGFDQNTEKPDLTTTTAVRLLLDKAGDVDEALVLLKQYDLHASAGMMVHFAITDTSGRSVAVEYVNNEMSVVETPIVTNFYLTPGEKYGIGTEESHRRYEILTETLADHPSMTAEEVRDAMDSVSKHNFDSVFASTEWSIVFDQTSGEARYYHRENFENVYAFRIGQ
nr:linear amide C-N hydrolase [uncultured Oscillibacter sp.]